MDKKLFAKQMGNLGVVFDRLVSKQLLELYYEDLKILTNDQMTDAVTKWRQTGEWFPKPSQLLDMVKTSAQSSGEAWALVLKEIRDYQSAKLPDNIMVAISEIGGLKTLAHMNERDLDFKGREFKAAYKSDRMAALRERLEQNPESRIEYVCQ